MIASERARQHVDLDQIAKARARFVEHALDVANHKSELRLKIVRKLAVLVKAGDDASTRNSSARVTTNLIGIN